MIVFKSINKINKLVDFKNNIGFVPTMGALHEGHVSLVKKSKKMCTKTIVSIFVNPKQFNSKKDLNKYPRKINKDLNILKSLKVDYVLIPKIKDIYKNKVRRIKLAKKDKILCAKYRPGHFEGVLQVIEQFFKRIKPKMLFLGEKDFQQMMLIKNFLRNKYKVKIIPCKTIRHKKGYAYSSRNERLNKTKDIKVISSVAFKIRRIYLLIKKNLNNIEMLKDLENDLNKYPIKIEYLEIRNKNNLSIKFNKNNFKIFLAYYYKNIRFIDNF